MDNERTRPLADASLATVVEQAFDAAKDLAADEARLFLDEMGREQARAEALAALSAGAAALATVGLAWIGVGVLLAVHATGGVIVSVGVIALVIAGGLGLGVYRMIPEVTFEKTRARLAQRAKRVVAAAEDEPAPAMPHHFRQGVEP